MRRTTFGLAMAFGVSTSAAWAQNPPSAAPAAPPPSTDVYMVRLIPRLGVFNITNRAGYDNQPAFVGQAVFYTAQVDGQTDIYQLNTETSAIGPVVRTPESEYSAAATPDGLGYAVIRVEMDSTQRLWRFPIRRGAEPSIVLRDIKPVGYFAYLDSTTLALFVLGSPNTLQIADTRTGKGMVVTTNIGRSLQHVPGGRRASFTQRVGGKTLLETVDPTLARTDLSQSTPSPRFPTAPISLSGSLRRT